MATSNPPSSVPGSPEIPAWAPALCCALFFGLALLLMSPELGDFGGDSAQYLSLARGIAEGRGYVDLHLPGNPPHRHYPPGFPLLLAPLVAVFGPAPILPAKVFCAASIAVGAWFAWRLLRRLAGPRAALAALGLSLSSTALLLQAVRIQSEAPYFLLVYAALLLLVRGPERRADQILLCLLAAGAFLVRVAGLVLIAVMLLGLRRRLGFRRTLLPACFCLLPVALFLLRAGSGGGGTWSYAEEWGASGLGALPSRLLEHAVFTFRALGARLTEHPFWIARPWLLSVPVLVSAVGFLRRWRGAGPRDPEIFFLLSLVATVLAPMKSTRYLLPLLPLLGLYLWLGGEALVIHAVRKGGKPVLLRRAAGTAFALLLLSHLLGLGILFQGRTRSFLVSAPPLQFERLGSVRMQDWEEVWLGAENPEGRAAAKAWGDFLLLCKAAKTDLPEEAVVASRKPRLFFFLTERRSVPLPGVGRTAEESLDRLRRAGADHLCLDGLFVASRKLGRQCRKVLGPPVLAVRGARIHVLSPRAVPGK